MPKKDIVLLGTQRLCACKVQCAGERFRQHRVPVLSEFVHVSPLCGVLVKHLIQRIRGVQPVGKFCNHLK